MAASRVYHAGILKTTQCWTSKRLLHCFHPAKDSLHFNFRKLPTVLSQLQCHPSSELKRCITSFPPGLTTLSHLFTFRTCSRQFVHCFCSKSSRKDIRNESSSDPKKDTHSHISDVEPKLSHVNNQGHAQMVDVGGKKESNRLAVAAATVYLGLEAFHLVKKNKIHKGDVLTVAQLAGIMASKQTPNLIPLCHNIHITHSEVNLKLEKKTLL